MMGNLIFDIPTTNLGLSIVSLRGFVHFGIHAEHGKAMTEDFASRIFIINF